MPEVRKARVYAACGHTWLETRPASVPMVPGELRACALCRPGDPGVVDVSPQGLGMVPVEYVTVEVEGA